MKSYREILKSILEERIKANPQYSLRAFAKSIDLAAPRLSSILSEKQGLSESCALGICNKLSLTDKEKEYFVTSVLASDARSKTKRSQARKRLKQFQSARSHLNYLDDDSFRMVSDWQHFTLLELMQTKDFKNDPAWMAKRLGITKFEATQTLKRLVDNKLAHEVDGNIQPTEASTTTSSDVPSEAIRKFNRQILEKAAIALNEQNVHERDFSTLTIGMGKKHIPEIKQMIKAFRRELNAFAENIPINEREEVYILSSNLFKLTKEIGE